MFCISFRINSLSFLITVISLAEPNQLKGEERVLEIFNLFDFKERNEITMEDLVRRRNPSPDPNLIPDLNPDTNPILTLP
jgi:hypothetical protein